MMTAGEKIGSGNVDQVRAALHGITGVEPIAALVRERWYMLVVRSNHELDAVDSLRRRGLRAYWPNYERLVATRQQFEGRPVRRLVRSGIVPYVFSPATLEVDFTREIESIVAVLDVVRTASGLPLMISDADIDAIRKIAIDESSVKPENSPHALKIGEKVRFRDDAASHWPSGTIIKLAREGRITIEIDLMGRKVPIKAFPFQIARV
jgi:transcription antitermination factor NusG